MGESLLERLGRAITITRAGNGKYALRSALVAAAFSKDGLSLLSVLEKFPTNVQIHGEKVLGAAKTAERVIKATDALSAEMRTLTAQEAANLPPVDYEALPDPRQPGPFTVNKEVWNLVDQGRNRKFYVDVYRPEGKEQKITSVIVFSHGLASRPEDYRPGAQATGHPWFSRGRTAASRQRYDLAQGDAEGLSQGHLRQPGIHQSSQGHQLCDR